MKKSAFCWFITLWAGMGGVFSHTLFASPSYRDITLQTAGTLIDSLATDDAEIDSIVVRGPINDFDFSALRNIAQLNKSIVINLAYANVENKTIPEEAFSEYAIYKRIKRVILPDDIHTIEAKAFASITSLTDVNMPTGLRKLGEEAFFGCSSLAPDTLRIPEGVESIPRLCFSGCNRLKHIVFPKSLKHIENAAFNQDYWVQSLTFQEGLESIGFMAFYGMGVIDTIRLPESVTMIDEAAFAQIWALKYINIPSGITTIPVDFAKSSELDNIYIPDNVITIKEDAFYATGCTSLRLSQNLATIESGAFHRNALTDILLPASLQFIGSQAFSSETVRKVYCPANIPPALESTNPGEWAFAGCTENATLFVPVGCGDAYRNTPGWNNFSHIEETAQFPSSIEQVSDAGSWSATAGQGVIVLNSNAATTVTLRIHTLGGEVIGNIKLSGRNSIAMAPGTYLISDGKRAKTIFVR